MNLPRFRPERYSDSRPLYPVSIYSLLRERLGPARERVFLDLACGAGQSTLSFAGLGLASRGFAIDADPGMVEAARARIASAPIPIDVRVGAAERIPLEDSSVDLVLVGSAIHWFDLARAKPELERVLRAGGILFVYEYQFPRCLEDDGLNEWIRRRFNLEWKAPNQVPRGSLSEILAPFRRSPAWDEVAEARPEWIERFGSEGFLAHLFSQSRYLHAEDAAADPSSYREEIAARIRPVFNGRELRFDMRPRAFRFRFCGTIGVRSHGE
jgi:SAM-dependent methyltransferase